MQSYGNPAQFSLNSFKRHFSKVRKAYIALAEKNEEFSFNFTLSYSKDSGIHAESKTPDAKKTMMFIVLMRRFLNPMDHVFWKNIWSILKSSFADTLPSENITSIESLICEVDRGYGAITINGQNFNAERIYTTVANGEYFGKTDKDAVELLESLSSTPGGPYLLHQFYIYNLGVFHLASILLDLILTVEKCERYSYLYGKETSSDKRCIFCMSEVGPFTSEEHIVPEALGNYDTVLPEGYVCDPCNNTVLSQLDEILADSDILRLLRVYFVPYTKSGKFPKAKYQNVFIEKIGPNSITFRDTTNRRSFIPGHKREDGFVEFTINQLGRKKFDGKSIGRALYKIGLEMLAFHLGRDAVYNSQYDAARSFVLNGLSFPNNLLILNSFVPNPIVSSSLDSRWGGTSFEMHIYGVVFFFNLEENPVLEVTAENLSKLNISSFSLR